MCSACMVRQRDEVYQGSCVFQGVDHVVTDGEVDLDGTTGTVYTHETNEHHHQELKCESSEVPRISASGGATGRQMVRWIQPSSPTVNPILPPQRVKEFASLPRTTHRYARKNARSHPQKPHVSQPRTSNRSSAGTSEKRPYTSIPLKRTQ